MRNAFSLSLLLAVVTIFVGGCDRSNRTTINRTASPNRIYRPAPVPSTSRYTYTCNGASFTYTTLAAMCSGMLRDEECSAQDRLRIYDRMCRR